MPAKKKKSIPTMSHKKRGRKPGQKTKWNDSMTQTAVNIIFDTGRMENVPKALGVAKTTFYRWMETKRELKDALARARETRMRIQEQECHVELKADHSIIETRHSFLG